MFPSLKDRVQLYKLRRQEKKLDEEGKRKRAEIKEKKDESIWDEWYGSYARYEYGDIEFSRKKIVSDALLKEADELHLPRPAYEDTSKWVSVDDFRDAGVSFALVLTPEAMADLRSVIRKEKRERRETVEWWVKLLGGLIGILTGLVGALIGLVSVWKHK